MNYKLPRRTLLAGGIGLLAAPSLIGIARAATTLRFSTSFPNDPKFSTARIWYDLFLPRLKAAVGDQIAIQFFPDNQLGQEADVVNQVKLGRGGRDAGRHVDLDQSRPRVRAYSTSATSSRTSTTSAGRTATPEGAALANLLVQKAGTHFPAWGRNLGARNFLTKFAFKTPAELAGKKIRSLPNPIVTETVRLMGAAATPMAFGEIYTGLQAGRIDGLEHDAPTMLSAKFYETAKYFTLTRHIYTPFGAFISDRTLQAPPAARCGMVCCSPCNRRPSDHWDRAAQIEADAVENLKQLGVTVEECDRPRLPRACPSALGQLRPEDAGREALSRCGAQGRKRVRRTSWSRQSSWRGCSAATACTGFDRYYPRPLLRLVEALAATAARRPTSPW